MILAAPIALPLIALAGMVPWRPVRTNLTLRFLSSIVVVLGLVAVTRESFFYLYDPTQSAWPLFLEYGSEFMASAILVVILAGSVGRLTPVTGGQNWVRILSFGCGLTIVVGILALLPQY